MGKSLKKKKMCKLDASDIEKNVEAYRQLVDDPRYLCTKCVRTSRTDKNLCNAKKIKPKQ